MFTGEITLISWRQPGDNRGRGDGSSIYQVELTGFDDCEEEKESRIEQSIDGGSFGQDGEHWRKRMSEDWPEASDEFS